MRIETINLNFLGAEMLADGATPEESGRYDLAGDYSNLVDDLMRYVAKRRD